MQQDMSKEAAEEILELPHRYTKEDVRRAYTELARRYHPDAAAKHHYNLDAAQERMVQANKANDVLKQLFTDDPDRVVSRVAEGISGGFSGVDWKAGWESYEASGTDPWGFAGDWDGTADEATAKPPSLTLRSVLLGPVVLRVVFVVLFGLWWWSACPLLPHNLPRFLPAGQWTLFATAHLVAAIVYPTYLLAYEAVSGYVSGLVREALNGVVSWVTRTYVDLRPKSSSYGCALYKLIREQVYALLLAPLALFAVAAFMEQTSLVPKVIFGALALFLAVDTLAACTRGGFVNVWAASLSDWVESQYLLLRARLLKRCGVWEG